VCRNDFIFLIIVRAITVALSENEYMNFVETVVCKFFFYLKTVNLLSPNIDLC